jgi:hypothetical protein
MSIPAIRSIFFSCKTRKKDAASISTIEKFYFFFFQKSKVVQFMYIYSYYITLALMKTLRFNKPHFIDKLSNYRNTYHK